LSDRETFALVEIPEPATARSYDPLVEGQPFFTTIAGLAVSLAGFGAVIAWLRDDPSGWDPVNLWRVKTIVRHALTVAFICLALVPVYTFTQDEALTIRFGSVFVTLFTISDIWRIRQPDPVIWDRTSLTVFRVTNGILGIGAIANLFWADLGVLQVLVLALLTSPAGIFSNFVREIGARPTASEPET
jgi:hypothetical protein